MPTNAKLGIKLQQHTVQTVICIKVIKLRLLGRGFFIFCLEINSMALRSYYVTAGISVIKPLSVRISQHPTGAVWC